MGADFSAMGVVSGMSGHSQLAAQGFCHLANGGEFRLAVFRQCLIQAFPIQTSLFCYLRHAFFSGEMAKGDDEQARIIVREGVVKVFVDFFLAFQIIKGIVRGCSLAHTVHLNLFRQRSGFCDVAGLAGLVATGQHDNDFPRAQGVIQPVARADKQPHFAHATTNRGNIAKVAEAGAVKPFSDSLNRLTVSQILQPCVKLVCLLDFVFHKLIVACKLQIVKVDYV